MGEIERLFDRNYQHLSVIPILIEITKVVVLLHRRLRNASFPPFYESAQLPANRALPGLPLCPGPLSYLFHWSLFFNLLPPWTKCSPSTYCSLASRCLASRCLRVRAPIISLRWNAILFLYGRIDWLIARLILMLFGAVFRGRLDACFADVRSSSSREELSRSSFTQWGG